MPVNQTFANYSDLAFKAAFAIYIVALVMSLVYYVKQQMLIDARRESKVLVESIWAGHMAQVRQRSGTAD